MVPDLHWRWLKRTAFAPLLLILSYAQANWAATFSGYHGESNTIPSDATTPALALSSAQITAVSADDALSHSVAVTGNGRFAQMRFVQTIDELDTSVSRINIGWIGRGVNAKTSGSPDDGATLYIWNYATSSYQALAASPDTEAEVSLGGSVTTNAADFIGGALEDTITVLVSTSSRSSGNQALSLITDYISIEVTLQVVDHFLISHNNYGINCANETVTVQPIDANGDVIVDYAGTIVLDTQSGNGSWIATSGNGNLVDAVANDGLATYAFSGTETMPVSFTLQYPSGTAVFDIDAYVSGDAAIRDDDSEGNMTFAASGFTVTANQLSNPPPNPINDPIQNQVSGTLFNLHIAAYGITATDSECGIIEAYDGNKNLNFWMDYQNPVSGTLTPTVDATSIAASEATSVQQGVVFTQGRAVVQAKYKDVGQIQINMKDDNPAVQPNVIQGSTNPFVVKPDRLRITQVQRADLTANPAAVDENGVVFAAAGENFIVTVEVRDAENSLTPNFGNETSAEELELVHTLIAPAMGVSGTLANAGSFSVTATPGRFENTSVNWNEVGIINLSPQIFGDNDYLGTGSVAGVVSGNVGRFIPHRLSIADNTPALANGTGGWDCSFTYQSQPFGFAVGLEPEFTLTAESVSGTVANNYGIAYWKLSGELANRSYANVAVGAGGSFAEYDVTSTALLAGENDYDGQGTLTVLGDELVYNKAALLPTATDIPFTADVSMTLPAADLTDADGACYDPDDDGTCDDYSIPSLTSPPDIRFGRLVLDNAYGPETLALPMGLRAEHWDTLGAGQDFVVNTLDNNALCSGTTLVDAPPGPPQWGEFLLAAYTENLAAGETTPTYNAMVDGEGNLELSASGAGNYGSVTVTIDLTAMPWLRFPFEGVAGGDLDPKALAYFGQYRGNDQIIYWREQIPVP